MSQQPKITKEQAERIMAEIKKGEDSGISEVSHEEFWKKHGQPSKPKERSR